MNVEPVRVFVGYDDRSPLSYNVMRHSLERHGGLGIQVKGLFIKQLPITRQGATEFTYSRFLVPWLCDYKGFAVFCDQDQVVTSDIAELVESVRNGSSDVYVNKAQVEFEWPSVMVFNCEKCTTLTPDYVQNNKWLFSFEWASEVGSFSPEWNHPVGMKSAMKNTKLYHFTQGIPYWPECSGLDEDEFWWSEYRDMVRTAGWIDLHRNTKHFPHVMKRFLTKYGLSIGAPSNV